MSDVVGGNMMASATISYMEGNYIFVVGQDTSYEEIVFPIPLILDNQVPIYLNLTGNPPELVSNIKLNRRDDTNWVVNLTLSPMKAGQKLDVKWECSIFIMDEGSDEEFLEAGREQYDSGDYLMSSLCVQSEHSEIQKKAFDLKSHRDAYETITNVLAFLQEIKAKADRDYKSLDALEALYHGGSCVSAANLATALLRANGIPTRILATHPTWFGRHQTHYVMESFVPYKGWIRMDPSVGKIPDLSRNNIIMSIIRLQDENSSHSRWQYPMRGVPYLSLPEKLTSGNIGYMCPRGGPHKALIIRKFEESPDLVGEAFIKTKEKWEHHVKQSTEKSSMIQSPNNLIEASNSQNMMEYLRTLA